MVKKKAARLDEAGKTKYLELWKSENPKNFATFIKSHPEAKPNATAIKKALVSGGLYQGRGEKPADGGVTIATVVNYMKTFDLAGLSTIKDTINGLIRNRIAEDEKAARETLKNIENQKKDLGIK